MINKVIHYCWFGRGKKTKKALECIESWRKYCPEYKIIEWNEDNFDINSNLYVKQAYEAKKYAFVTDYVRLYVMYNYGGIYMDTDVEVIRPLDDFLHNEAFSGFELPSCVPTGIMASVKEFELFKEFLNYYKNKPFIDENKKFDMTTNVSIITNIMGKYGLKKDGTYQVIKGFALYPQDFFCPLDNATGLVRKTENTATIHWFSKSWVDSKIVYRSRITRIFHRIFGKDCFKWIKRIIGE
ncbi:glycosyl transferase [Terrisporobacter glycolicus]|nr:glycosyl transferase [Terrisporobacter glycolicus]